MSAIDDGGGGLAQNPAQTFLALMGKFREVNVHFDADAPDVVLPDGYSGATMLTYGYNLAVPIHDLFVSRLGVRATLSFRRSPFKTFVPWSAVALFTIADAGKTDGFKTCGATMPDDAPLVVGGAPPRMLTCILGPHGDDIDHVCMEITSSANSHGIRSVGADEAPPEGDAPARAAWTPRVVR